MDEEIQNPSEEVIPEVIEEEVEETETNPVA